MADIEATRAKWRQVLQSSNDEATIARAHEVLARLADLDPELAKHKQKFQEKQSEMADLEAQPDPTSAGEVIGAVGTDLKNRALGIGHAVKEVATHPKELLLSERLGGDPRYQREFVRGVDDSVLLGYGRVAGEKLANMAGKTFEGTEAEDKAAAPGIRAGGSIAGAFLPSPTNYIGGKAMQGLNKLIPHSSSVLGEAVRGAGRSLATYEATAPVSAALHADSGGGATDLKENLVNRAKAFGHAATDPANFIMAAGTGAATSAAGELLGNAPKRQEESELKGLTDEVQYGSKMRKFRPNKDAIRSELNDAPEIRALVKSDPVKAKKMVDAKLDEVNATDLDPFYAKLGSVGQDAVPVQTVKGQLQGVLKDYTGGARKPIGDAISRLMDEYDEVATQNNGRIPIAKLRRDATDYQSLGFGGSPLFESAPLAKQAKRDLGGALRESIGDHIESLAGNTSQGKALRTAYENANKRVSTWIRIKELIDETADRQEHDAPSMGSFIKEGKEAVKHPLLYTAKHLAAPAADLMDRKVLGPLVSSPFGQAVAPLGRAAAGAANRAVQLPGYIPEIEQAYADYLRRQQQENQ